MESDIQGCSTTQSGQEQYEEFKSNGRKLVQYDYRHSDGELFSCVAKNLSMAREKRNAWLQDRAT